MRLLSLATTALIAIAACGPRTAESTRAPGVGEPVTEPAAEPDAPEPAAAAKVSADHDVVAITTIDETEARLLLAELFRDAGYRILYDVEVLAEGGMLAVDGFDPDKQVGFEYIAAAERETATQAAAVATKSTAKVLLVGPSTRDDLLEAARAFIAAREAERDQPAE